jgi:hypothetical protein
VKIHIAHNGEKVGPFSSEEIRQKLAAGELHKSDLAWYEGAPDWMPILALPDLQPLAVKVPPIPPIRPVPANGSAAQMPTSPLAIASMVLGIVSLSVFPLVPGIPAVICGHLSLKEIRRSAGAVGGRGAAIAGLVTGYMSVAIMLAVIVGILAFVGIASTHHSGGRAVQTPQSHSHSADHEPEPEAPTR